MTATKKRMFTRKHYLALQSVIRAYSVAAPIESHENTVNLIRAICAMFRAEYPEFDENRFLKLSGLSD